MAVTAGLALWVGGCSDPAGPVAEVEDAAARWAEAGLSSYSYVYDQSCFCPYYGPLRLTVEDGVVTAVDTLPETTMDGPPPAPGEMPTIEDLFERLRSAAERDPVRFEVTYDETLGYPTRAVVDISRQIADEEYSFDVSDLVPATGE